MITFSKKDHDAIKTGKITLTFRDWSTLSLQKNKIYKSSNLGLLRVLDISFVKLSDITIDEIKKSGLRSFHQFRDEYEEKANRKVNFNKEAAVKIEFEYLGKDIENKKRLMGKVTPMELYEIKEKILILDEKSDSPWAIKTLQTLSQNGSLFLKDIEKILKIPAEKIKQNMRELKDLNLIYSNSKKGYSLTPLSLKLFKILYKL